MHEMSLVEGVIRILETQAVTHGFTKVKTVWLEIGALSSVDPESMLFCFGAIAKGSPIAAEAVLEIIRVEAQATCLDCMNLVQVATRHDPCPQCGGYKLSVVAGEDMRVKELEVE